MDQASEKLPFGRHNELVGLSRKTHVYGYDNSGVVIKVPKPGEKRFDSFELAKEDLQRYRQSIEEARRRLELKGGNKETMVEQEAVIHDAPEGGITYSRVQRWIKGAKPLSQVGGGVLNLESESLKELRRVFEVNISLWQGDRSFLDIVGSSTSKQPIHSRALKHLFPLFYSENIMVDKANEVRVVDIGGVVGGESLSLSTKLRGLVQYMGSVISVALIDRELRKRGFSS